MYPFDVLVLAAGCSSRMGVSKVLLPAGPGETVLSRVVGSALSGVSGRVVVVVGRDAALAQEALARWATRHGTRSRDRLHVVHNPEFESGLATSLTAGIRYLLAGGNQSAGLAVMLGDQPLVSSAQVQRLVRAVREGGSELMAAVAVCEGGRRNPVAFPKRILPELLNLKGDEGARSLLQRHAERVEGVELGPGLWARDLDTWEDYRAVADAAGWTDGLAEAPVRPHSDSQPA